MVDIEEVPVRAKIVNEFDANKFITFFASASWLPSDSVNWQEARIKGGKRRSKIMKRDLV